MAQMNVYCQFDIIIVIGNLKGLFKNESDRYEA